MIIFSLKSSRLKLQHQFILSAILQFLLLLTLSSPASAQNDLGADDLDRIGNRIWQNECNGSVEGLTSWNGGEDFASLGIGHFIWYPEGKKGPFEESFPMLLQWFEKRKIAVPDWLAKVPSCPWPNRTAFRDDNDSPKMKELRKLLENTVREQTRFIIYRLDQSMARMQAAAGSASARVLQNIKLLRQTSAGSFAMIDYVNFKGDGMNSEEKYKGEGWGLLQVLSTMQAADAKTAPAAFSEAAKSVLTRRVKNSPPSRGEEKWLSGWLNRCETYRR